MKSADPEQVAALRAAVARMSRTVFQRGLVSGTGGNVSVRLPGTDQALITRTGASLGEVEPEEILQVDEAGQVVGGGPDQRPSMETPIHLQGYRLRPDVSAIIHLHPPYTVALSLRGEPLPLVTVSARLLLGHVPCIPVAYPKTRYFHRLMEETLDRFPRVGVILMQAHGLTAYADDLTAAFHLADLVEATAQQAYLAQAAGLRFRLPEPEELPELESSP